MKARSVAVITSVLSIAACQKDIPVDVSVIGPSGANPFTGAMGATRIRMGFEDDPQSVQEANVASGAAFNLSLRPTDPRSTARLRVDVLRDSTIIAQGATPQVAWVNIGSSQLRVFVQAADSVVLAPGGAMAAPRADFQLVSAGGSGAVAYTLPTGAADAPPDQYFLPAHTQRRFTYTVSSTFDGETSVVVLSGGGVLLLRGPRALVFDDSSSGSPPVNAIPNERGVLHGGSVVSDGNYGYVLGGRDDGGLRSARIDRVSAIGDVEGVSYTLATPRARAGVLTVVPPGGAATPVFLVYGGQDPACATCGSMELLTIGTGSTALASLGASIDRRTEFEATCVQRNSDRVCTRLLLLGGVDANAMGALAAKDVLIDLECARAQGAGPSCVRGELELLSSRRRGVRAAVGSDGVRVVVTGGRGATDTPNYQVDVINASDVATLRRVEGDRTITAADPAVLAMADGSVMIAGGIDRMTTRPTGSVWFLRGPIAPLSM